MARLRKIRKMADAAAQNVVYPTEFSVQPGWSESGGSGGVVRTGSAIGSGTGGESVASPSEAKPRRPTGKDSGMVGPTREEIDAKLAAVEARVEAKLVGIDGKLDRIVDQIASSVFATNQKIDLLSEKVSNAGDDAREAKKAAGDIKWHVLYTALGVVAVIFAMWAVWAQGIEMVAGLFGGIKG